MSGSLPLVRLPSGALIHRLGSASSSAASAVLRFPQAGLTVRQDAAGQQPQGWAIVGDGDGRRLVVETLLSRHRIYPHVPPPGPFPHIAALQAAASSSSVGTQDGSVSPSSELPAEERRLVRHLAFARPPPTGEFTDFTARYGALQEEDRLSFRETLAALQPQPSPADIERVARMMRISHLLDLPSVSLSSGQTRRARIAAALLTRPALLLLEEPMAGLDVGSRAEVSGILDSLNSQGDIRVMLVLRGKEGGAFLPPWVTDVVDVRDGNVWVGSKAEWVSARDQTASASATTNPTKTSFPPLSGASSPRLSKASDGDPAASAEPLVQLQDVSVSYGEGTRPVLKKVSWEIRPGEKWHLQGANGSGKTTLLSLVLGHHPQSFSLPPERLRLFSKPRRLTPTPVLRTLIGHTSPEIYAAFPRGMGLSAFQAVGTGFEGVFSRRDLSPAQKERVLGLLSRFKDDLAVSRSGFSAAHDSSDDAQTVLTIAKRSFANYTPSQQALLLFLRAIVARPPMLVLDEPAQGMDEPVWRKCTQLLADEWREKPEQAVVVVSHYEDEVPWAREDGKVYKLDAGVGTVE